MFSAELLIDQYYSRLRHYARRMLGHYPAVRRWEDTDDVVQLSLLRLIRALESTSPESELHFRRLACLQIRRMLVDLARSLSGPNGLARNHETNYGSPPFVSTAAESRNESLSFTDWEEFHLAVDRLDEGDKEIVDLCWYSGLPTERVAKMLAQNERTVQRRYRNARIALGRLLRNSSQESGVVG